MALSSDAGWLLLRDVDKGTRVTTRVPGCFDDYRNPASVEHSVHNSVAQRVYQSRWNTKTSRTMGSSW